MNNLYILIDDLWQKKMNFLLTKQIENNCIYL